MKNSARSGFTLVELLIGIVMMVIVIGGIAFTVSSGFDLYTKADSNAVVISGVRFTADSFNRNVAPMLNYADKIEILPASFNIPGYEDITSDDIHYIYLPKSKDSVFLRNSKGDHMLEGSEHIESILFTIPESVSSSDISNYIVTMNIKGKNKDHSNAKLELDVESSLYNMPTKIGSAESGVFSGNILKIESSPKLYIDRLNLHDEKTKIRIDEQDVFKGTKIEAIYDLFFMNPMGGSDVMSDDSTIEWFISGNVSTDNSDYKQLYSGSNPLLGKFLPTTETLFDKDNTSWPFGVIKCRVTPKITPKAGGLTVTGTPKWSDYVVIKPVTSANNPSKEFESIGDFLGSPSGGTGDIILTDKGKRAIGDEDDYEDWTNFKVNSDGSINMVIGEETSSSSGAALVIKINDDKFDKYNDMIYRAWTAGRDSVSDIPSYITVTNYSVIFDSKLDDDEITSSLFLSTRSNNDDNEIFKDVGYAVNYAGDRNNKGFSVAKFKDGKEIANGFGVYNYKLKNKDHRAIEDTRDSYHPHLVTNDIFKFSKDSDSQWKKRYRVMYTVLEYYEYNASDPNQGKYHPRYIFRVRFLKRTDQKADNPHPITLSELAGYKSTDPWCIGPYFYASEPMWFGDFVGNPGETTKTVKVKNYDNNGTETEILHDVISTSDKHFYGLKNFSNKYAVFKKRLMDARENEIKIDETPINSTNIPNTNDQTGLSIFRPSKSRYIGVRGVDEDEEKVTIYGLDFAPGFTINEIRSIMPVNGKLYSIEESVPSSELSKIAAKDWYKSYKNIIASSNNDINKKIFGVSGKSDGSGDNGSWYYQYAGSDGGIYDLQHIKSGCKCPLHNELFKWFGGE